MSEATLLVGRGLSDITGEAAECGMLGYGRVIVHGTGGTPETFNMIAHPLEFRTQVQQQIEQSLGKTR